jgi:mannose-6-phosphate isomerase-like protein (cupin superfamily)
LLVPLIPLRENEVWDPEPEKDPHSPRRTLLEIVGPADGPLVHFGGLGVRFLIDGLRSGGGFSLVEHPIEPRCLAAPMHTHEREDEYTFVLEGEVGVQVAEDVAVARPATLSSNLAESRTPSGIRATCRPGCWKSSPRRASSASSPSWSL